MTLLNLHHYMDSMERIAGAAYKNVENAYKNDKNAKLYAQNLSKADIFKEISLNIRIKLCNQPVLSVKRQVSSVRGQKIIKSCI